MRKAYIIPCIYLKIPGKGRNVRKYHEMEDRK